jgi:hypothetical protein
MSIYLRLYSPLDLGRFFSFLILYTVSSIPCMGDQPIARLLPTHRTTQTEYKHTDIHALSRIRNHDRSVRASEDSSCLRPRGHCESLYYILLLEYDAVMFKSFVYVKKTTAYAETQLFHQHMQYSVTWCSYWLYLVHPFCVTVKCLCKE